MAPAVVSDPEQPRVLSLLSASTEIVCRLGCAHLLVGRSHGCDAPPLVTALPTLTAPNIDPSAPSAEIDRAVRLQSDSGGPVYRVHNDLVVSARPTVILTQEQCRICAVTADDVAAACAALPAPARLVTIKPVTLEDVLGDVGTIAAALGVAERGRRLVRLLRRRLVVVREECAGVAAARPPPKVAHLEWLSPIMGSGYWIAECVAAAGCAMVHGVKGGHSPTLRSLSQLADADVILLAPCGFSLQRTRTELRALSIEKSPEWQALRAVREGRVYVADGNLYFNRSSCAVVDTAEIVAEIAWPEIVGLWGHHGQSWVRLSELDRFCDRLGAILPTPTKCATAASIDADADLITSRIADSIEAQEPSSAVEAVRIASKSPAAHVRDQVEHIRSGDFVAAFALNSRANRARLGDASAFKSIVAGSDGFATLADSTNAWSCAEDGGEDGRFVVSARVETVNGGYEFAFDVCAVATGYATEGVRILC